MTNDQMKVYLRAAVERGNIRAWSNPAPDVWYLSTEHNGTPQLDDAAMLNFVGVLDYCYPIGEA